MRIVSLILKGYKRLALRGITSFAYNPKQDMQLILGTNGSGKSSVMREMSPLPANPSDYFKEGSKEIIVEHRGVIYTLTSVFLPKNEHRFIVNNENLNKGGTITVQKELVKQHFNIDQELFNVLIDDTVFTEMPALKRRDWIIELSGNDMTYALSIFQKLKTKLRDSQGVVKHLSKRLADETQNLPTKEIVDEMRLTCDRLKGELNQLMQLKYPDIKTTQKIEQELGTYNKQVTTLASTILKTFTKLKKSFTWSSISDLLNAIEEQREILTYKTAQLESVQKEYASFEDIIKAMELSNNVGVEELHLKIEEAKLEAKQLYDTVEVDVGKLVGNQDIDKFIIACEQLLGILEDTSDNQFLRFTDDKKQSVNNEINILVTVMNERQKTITGLQHAKQHLLSSDTVTCPRCSLQFIAAYKNLSIDDVEKRLNELTELHNRDELVLKEHRQFVEEYQQYASLLTRLNNIFVKYHDYASLWFVFKSHWKTNPIPTVSCGFLHSWIKQANDVKRLIKLMDYIRENESVLIILRENTHANSEGLKTRISIIEDNIVTLGNEITAIKTEIAAMTSIRKQFDDMAKQYDSLKDVVNQLSVVLTCYLKAIHNDDLDNSINDRMTLLASTESLFLKSSRALSVIEDLTATKNDVSLNLEALALLVDELSPTEGLIAEQINAFMTSFVGSINQIISKIWTYDLQVLPCSLADGELDYLFPLSVNLHDLMVPDVSKGSSSQVDIVNFAFKIVVMLFLDMRDYPLYLDELAPSLDEQHRLNIIMFVKEFLEMRNASQLFMISHYAAMHGAFSQTDICVMDSTNVITLPEYFNQVVTIERG